jgi:hypothetical protein
MLLIYYCVLDVGNLYYFSDISFYFFSFVFARLSQKREKKYHAYDGFFKCFEFITLCSFASTKLIYDKNFSNIER